MEGSAVWHTVPEMDVCDSYNSSLYFLSICEWNDTMIKTGLRPGDVFIHDSVEAVVEVTAGKPKPQ